jgi:hypothetical protein
MERLSSHLSARPAFPPDVYDIVTLVVSDTQMMLKFAAQGEF